MHVLALYDVTELRLGEIFIALQRAGSHAHQSQQSEYRRLFPPHGNWNEVEEEAQYGGTLACYLSNCPSDY